MNELSSQLKQLGLRATAGGLDQLLARAAAERWPHRRLIEEMAAGEAGDRSRRSLERRLRLSGVRRFKPMADFDWSWPDKIERGVIEQALSLEVLARCRNMILVGQNGLGKTMIASNICHAAVLACHPVRFLTASALLDDLYRQSPEGRRRKLRCYGNTGLLCIDELGYLSYDDKAADLLFEVVNRRYERKPLMLTTNRPFKEWGEIFPNAACTTALLDRLLHHADITVIEGDSYRMKDQQREAAARRDSK